MSRRTAARTDNKRDDFHYGDVELDRFFQKFAGQNQFRLHIGTTYVAVIGSKIVGFVTWVLFHECSVVGWGGLARGSDLVFGFRRC